MSQRILRTLLAVLAAGALLYFGQFILAIVFTSLFVSLVLSPIAARLVRWRVPPTLAALFAVFLFVGISAIICTGAYGRAMSFADALPRNSRQIRAQLHKLTERAAELEKTTASALPAPADEPPLKVTNQPGWSDLFAQLGLVSELLFAVTFVPFMVFFMLTGADHARRATVNFFDADNRAEAAETIDRIVSIIRNFVVGNLLLGVLLGVVSTAILAAFRVPHFYILGGICGYLTLVPYLGGFMAPLLPMMISASTPHDGGGHLFLLGCAMLSLHLFTINVVYPKVIGGTLRLNPLSSTLALLIWGWLWGPLGLVFALPLTAALKAVCDHVEPLQPYGMWLGEESSVAEIRAEQRAAKSAAPADVKAAS